MLSDSTGIPRYVGVFGGPVLQPDRTMQPDKEKLTLYLPIEMVDRLRETAERDGVSQGGLVEAALRVFLNRAPAKQGTRGPVAALAVALRLRRRKKPTTLADIAAQLNRERFRTLQGRLWTVVSVSRLLKDSSAG